MTTSKEQVTTLGNVRFKPMQRDMFKGHLEDARRMLTRAEPSKSEALIYIERALVTANEL